MSTDEQPLIELRDVSLYYRRHRSLRGSRDHKVLNGISLNVRPGETLGIIGRNGAGKTTLLKLFAGIIAADGGSVLRRTERVSLLTFQLGFNQHLSGRENAIHTAMLQGMSRRAIEGRIEDVAAFAGLEDAIDQPLASYSAGMRARLGFAVSLQLDPDVLLVDEALGVGDHEFKERSSRAMRERMRSNKTVIVVSHDPFTVKELCDRAVWIENGNLVLEGMPEKVIEAYHNFDRVVSDMAVAMGTTENIIRSHASPRDPVEFMERLRDGMEQELIRQRDDYFASTERCTDKRVQLTVPLRRPVLSNLVREECGSLCWVENCRVVRRGEPAYVKKAYGDFERIVYKMAMDSKVTPEHFRTTDVYRQLVALLNDFATDPR